MKCGRNAVFDKYRSTLSFWVFLRGIFLCTLNHVSLEQKQESAWVPMNVSLIDIRPVCPVSGNFTTKVLAVLSLHRPGVLALKPSPIVASYLGYPGTVGAEYTDYTIADRVRDRKVSMVTNLLSFRSEHSSSSDKKSALQSQLSTEDCRDLEQHCFVHVFLTASAKKRSRACLSKELLGSVKDRLPAPPITPTPRLRSHRVGRLSRNLHETLTTFFRWLFRPPRSLGPDGCSARVGNRGFLGKNGVSPPQLPGQQL